MQVPVLSRTLWPRIALLAASGLLLVLAIVHCFRPMSQAPPPAHKLVPMDEQTFRRALQGQRLYEGVTVGDLDLGVVPVEENDPLSRPTPTGR